MWSGARQRDVEHNALAAAIGSSRRQTTTGTRTEATTTKSQYPYARKERLDPMYIRPAFRNGLIWRRGTTRSIPNTLTSQPSRAPETSHAHLRKW